MTETEALELIRATLEKAVNKPVTIDLKTHLIDDGLIDSLDSMVFLLDLSAKTGKPIADEDANNPDFFAVARLVKFLRDQ